MRASTLGWLAVLVAASSVAQAPNREVERHIAAARAAAGEHGALFERICPLPGAPAPIPATGGAARATPPRESWHAEPAKVFDNFYFVGMTEFSAWAVTTSEGIIVIDPLFDYSVEDEVVEGLRKLGLDPNDIEYVLVSHGHLDHVGGAKLLQERFGARVLLTAADWDLLDRDNPPWKPRRDMEIADGQKLTLGDTTLDDVSHAGAHARHGVDADSAARRREPARRGAVGRHGVQLRTRRGPLPRVRGLGCAVPRARDGGRRGRASCRTTPTTTARSRSCRRLLRAPRVRRTRTSGATRP